MYIYFFFVGKHGTTNFIYNLKYLHCIALPAGRAGNRVSLIVEKLPALFKKLGSIRVAI